LHPTRQPQPDKPIGTARIWRADEPILLRGHESSVESAGFSPDGTRVVTASDDGTARIWPLIMTLEQLAAYAHRSSRVS
jgi:WD40 repeat protein